MASYPELKFSPAYSYTSPYVQQTTSSAPQQEVKDTTIEIKPVVEQPVELKAALLAVGEQLDSPINSLPFLELYHKSAQKVESLSKTLKTLSYGLGCLGVVFFMFSMFSLMS